MKKELQIITKSQAVKLKKLGYNWDYRFFQNKSYSPITTIEKVFKWMRDEKEISVEITYNNLFPHQKMNRWDYAIVQMTKKRPCPADESTILGAFKTYEEAEKAALTHVLNDLLK